MIYCFDLDGTICDTNSSDYANSVPKVDVIERINRLFQNGHTIKVFTGRGATSGIDWREFTEGQLKKWGLKYHELIMGKPHADLFIDDKTISFRDWHLQRVKNLDFSPTFIEKFLSTKKCILSSLVWLFLVFVPQKKRLKLFRKIPLNIDMARMMRE